MQHTTIYALIEWLRAQLDDDERLALAASPSPWCVDPNDNEQVLAIDGVEVAAFALSSNQVRNTAIHIAEFDPARVLAEVKAKRAIVDDCATYVQNDEVAVTDGLALRMLCRLAEPYAGREGWQNEWNVTD